MWHGEAGPSSASTLQPHGDQSMLESPYTTGRRNDHDQSQLTCQAVASSEDTGTQDFQGCDGILSTDNTTTGVMSILLSPTSLLAISAILISLLRVLCATDRFLDLAQYYYELGLPRSLLLEDGDGRPRLPDVLPFLGTVPFRSIYEYNSSFIWDAPNISRKGPYNTTLILAPMETTVISRWWTVCHDKHLRLASCWRAPTQVNYFTVRFQNSRCIAPADTHVSGLYGQGTYIAWLLSAAFSIYNHEERQYWFTPNHKSLETFELQAMGAIDHELLATVSYSAIAMADLIIRISRADYDPATYATFHVVMTSSKIFQLCAAFWVGRHGRRQDHDSMRNRPNARHCCWVFLAAVGTIVSFITRVMAAWTSSRSAIIIALALTLTDVGIMLCICTFYYVHSPTNTSVISFSESFARTSGKQCGPTRLEILGYTFSRGMGVMFLGIFASATLIFDMSLVRDRMWAEECNKDWITDLFPTASVTISQLDQAAVLVGTVAIIFRGAVARLCVYMRCKNLSAGVSEPTDLCETPLGNSLQGETEMELADWAVGYGDDTESQDSSTVREETKTATLTKDKHRRQSYV